MEKKFEYAVAALNGEGINTLNENNELRYVGRLVYNAMGHHGYEFSDTKQSEEPNIAFGIAGMYNDTPNSDATAENKVTSLTADASLKYLGLGAHGGFFYQKTNPDGAGGNDNDYGLLSQIGYFVMPKTLEVGARYARVFADSGSDQTEYTGGLNYYIHAGHRVKLQLDYSVLVGEDGISAGDDQVNHRVRAQLQVKI